VSRILELLLKSLCVEDKPMMATFVDDFFRLKRLHLCGNTRTVG